MRKSTRLVLVFSFQKFFTINFFQPSFGAVAKITRNFELSIVIFRPVSFGFKLISNIYLPFQFSANSGRYAHIWRDLRGEQFRPRTGHRIGDHRNWEGLWIFCIFIFHNFPFNFQMPKDLPSDSLMGRVPWICADAEMTNKMGARWLNRKWMMSDIILLPIFVFFPCNFSSFFVVIFPSFLSHNFSWW